MWKEPLCHQLFCKWAALANWGLTHPFLTPIFCTWGLDSGSHMHHPSNIKPYIHFQSPRISEIIMCTIPVMDNFFQCLPARAQVRGFEWYYQLSFFYLRLFCVLQSQGRIKLDTVFWGKRRQQQFRAALDFWNSLFTKDTDMYLLEFIKHVFTSLSNREILLW